MPLPIALLALAGTAFAKPFYDDWVQGRQGKRAQGVMDAAGDDRDAQAQGFLRAGMITPADFINYGQDAARIGLQRDQLAQQQDQWQQGFQLDLGRFGLDRDRFSADQLWRRQDRALRMAGGEGGVQPLGQITAGVMDAAKIAIAANESQGFSDPYSVMGPATKNGDRAIGKYQVMASNVPSWTQEAFGVAMTPDEFRENKAAQEAVFEHRMGGYLDRYGNFQDAASAWFTGRPLAQAIEETPQGDGYTGTAQYVGQAGQAFNRQLGIQEAERTRQGEMRNAEIEAGEAAAPFAAGVDTAGTLLQGLDNIGRMGSGYLQTAEGKAQAQAARMAGEELYSTWQREVYGTAEPSPVTREELRAAFPLPGQSTWENRETMTRIVGLMQAELARKRDYAQAKVLYGKGLISADQFRQLNGGRLSQEEKNGYLRGNVAVPEGFREVTPGEVRGRTRQLEAPRGYVGRGGNG